MPRTCEIGGTQMCFSTWEGCRRERSSRIDSSIRDLGVDDVDTREKFEKTFITGADEAARVILAGVRRNNRRVLIGPDARIFDWVVRLLPSSY